MIYCLFYKDNKLTGFGLNCRPSPGMVEVSREEYYKATGDPRAAPEPPPALDALRADKHAEVSAACNAAIAAGVDVTLTGGAQEHFALTENDQINLNGAVAAIEQGAAAYPYHADGALCKLYPAADILAIGTAATAHKLYHTTYCNHLFAWIGRADADALAGITYGAQLPDDLAESMAAILAAVEGTA